MCQTCIDGICTNRCQQKNVQTITVSEETPLKLKGLSHAQSVGLSMVDFEDCYDSWEDALRGSGVTPSAEHLPYLIEAIDDYLKYNV